MVNHASIQDFSAAVRALRAASPNVRLVIRYGAGIGTEPGHLVAKVTDDKSTLTFRTDSKADLKDLDALSLWLLMADLQPDPAAPVAQVVAESTAAAPIRKPREHPSGSGAQRRAAGRARVLAGGQASLPSVRVRLKQRRLEARLERRRLRATGAVPVGEKN